MTIKRQHFFYKGWLFECQNGPIWGNSELHKVKGQLLPHASPIDHIPDAFFGFNYLRAHYVESLNQNLLKEKEEEDFEVVPEEALAATRFTKCLQCSWSFAITPFQAANGMILDCSQALDCIPHTLGFKPTPLRVKFAESWSHRFNNHASDISFGSIQAIEARYDWTCVSQYWGSVFGRSAEGSTESCTAATQSRCTSDMYSLVVKNPKDPPDIPLSLLCDTSIPILWLKQCDIFSDDLSDSGINTTQMKIRVMPTFWYLLYTQQVRVDDIAFRQIEVRLFHQFGTTTVLRELLWTEASYDTLLQRALCEKDANEKKKPTVDFSLLKKPDDVSLRLSQTFQLPRKRHN